MALSEPSAVSLSPCHCSHGRYHRHHLRFIGEERRPREVQPPTPGHPASKRNNRTFRHLCPALTTPSSPNSLTCLQDQNELPGDALEPALPWFSLYPDLSLAILPRMLCFSSLVPSPIGPSPGDSLQTAPGRNPPEDVGLYCLPARQGCRAFF